MLQFCLKEKVNYEKKSIIFNYAIKSNVPIIPFAVIGNFKPFTKVTYWFGKPIDYSEYKEKSKDKEFISKLTSELMENIVGLRDLKVG